MQYNWAGTIQIIFTFSNKHTSPGDLVFSNTVYLPSIYKMVLSAASAVGASGDFASQITINQNGNYVYLSTGNLSLVGYTISCIATLSVV